MHYLWFLSYFLRLWYFRIYLASFIKNDHCLQIFRFLLQVLWVWLYHNKFQALIIVLSIMWCNISAILLLVCGNDEFVKIKQLKQRREKCVHNEKQVWGPMNPRNWEDRYPVYFLSSFPALYSLLYLTKWEIYYYLLKYDCKSYYLSNQVISITILNSLLSKIIFRIFYLMW